MSILRINYSKVISQANTIDQLAKDFNSQIKGIETMEQEVRANWQGLASEELLKRINLLKTEMSNTYRKTSNLAHTIKSVAEKIKREDERDAERAKHLAKI